MSELRKLIRDLRYIQLDEEQRKLICDGLKFILNELSKSEKKIVAEIELSKYVNYSGTIYVNILSGELKYVVLLAKFYDKYVLVYYKTFPALFGVSYGIWKIDISNELPNNIPIIKSTSIPVNPRKLIIYNDHTVEVIKPQFYEVEVEGEDKEERIFVFTKLTQKQKLTVRIYSDSVGRIFITFENEKIYITFEESELPDEIKSKVFEGVNLHVVKRFNREIEKEVELTVEELRKLGIEETISL